MSFVDNIAAAVDALGVEAAGVVYGIGRIPWKTDAERDEFLRLIAGQGNG